MTRRLLVADVVPTGTHELAWAAGFFEGEGNVRFKPITQSTGKGHPSVQASVGQIARQPMDRFQRAVGGGTIHGPSYSQRANGGPMYYWNSAARLVIHQVCWLLWPWLGDVKRQQFDQAFKRFHAASANR